MLFDESWGCSDYRDRWLYTAIVRVAERLTIARVKYSNQRFWMSAPSPL